MAAITANYKLVLLPPSHSGDTWYGYVVHEDIPDLDERVWARGSTAGKCAVALERKLGKWSKSQPVAA